MTNNAWDLGSGLPLDDANATITKMEFGFNNNIGPGVVCANITFTTDEGDDHEQSFSVGNGWDIKDKGERIDGKTKLNTNTNYGRLVNSMVAAIGPDKVAEVLGGEGFRAAATFVGTKWHVTTTKVITTNPTTKEQKEKDAFVVSQYLGKGSDSKASTAGPKKSGKATLEDSDPDLFAELLSLAEDADDHDSFMEQALSLEAVEGNKMALNAVMSTKAGSVWAARGGDN